MKNKKMTKFDVFLMILLFSMPIWILKCQPSPDIACAELCRKHGMILDGRINKMWVQVCQCISKRQ